MARCVAFLRAINVGGRTVRMADLKRIFEGVPLRDVETFIASGNVIFEHRTCNAALESRIERALQRGLGYEVTAMLRTVVELQSILGSVEAQRMAPGSPGRLYIGFLKSAPSPHAIDVVSGASTESDLLRVHGRELYWASSAAYSQSPVNPARLEKLLGIPMTLRNVTTVTRLVARYGSGARG